MKERRIYTSEEKAEAVRRMRAGESVSELARELKVRRKLLYAWRDAVVEGRPLAGPGRPKRAPADATADALKRIAELERLVGQLTLENRFFRGALRRFEPTRRPQGATGETKSSRKSDQ